MFPLNLQKKTNKAQAINDEMISVNNFFGHWFTDLDIRRYSNAQMKHLPAQSVKKLAKTMLYSNKAVYLDDNDDRRSHNNATAAERTDLNLNERIKLFKVCIFQKNVYQIPLTLLCDLGKCNFSSKADNRIIITLERNLNKLFESKEKVANIPTDPDAFINIYARPYISYQEKNLTQSADLYFTGILRSETGLRQDVLPVPYQQEIEVNTGTQDFTCTFKGVQRQFDWLEI